MGGRLEAGMAKLCCVSDRKKVCSGPMLARPSHPASVSARSSAQQITVRPGDSPRSMTPTNPAGVGRPPSSDTKRSPRGAS